MVRASDGVIVMIQKIPDSGTVTIDSTNDKTAYTVPSNRKFELKTLIIINNEASATTYSIYDGGSTSGRLMMVITVQANSYVNLTQLEGFVFSTSVVVKASQYTNGGYVTVGGYNTI